MKHTPGPWHVGPHYKSDVESRQGRICECRPLMTPQSEANACVIAAAPELLAAAIEAENWLDNHGGDPERDSGLNGLLQMLRAAIAKAEGR